MFICHAKTEVVRIGGDALCSNDRHIIGRVDRKSQVVDEGHVDPYRSRLATGGGVELGARKTAAAGWPWRL